MRYLGLRHLEHGSEGGGIDAKRAERVRPQADYHVAPARNSAADWMVWRTRYVHSREPHALHTRRSVLISCMLPPCAPSASGCSATRRPQAVQVTPNAAACERVLRFSQCGTLGGRCLVQFSSGGGGGRTTWSCGEMDQSMPQSAAQPSKHPACATHLKPHTRTSSPRR